MMMTTTKMATTKMDQTGAAIDDGSLIVAERPLQKLPPIAIEAAQTGRRQSNINNISNIQFSAHSSGGATIRLQASPELTQSGLGHNGCRRKLTNRVRPMRTRTIADNWLLSSSADDSLSSTRYWRHRHQCSRWPDLAVELGPPSQRVQGARTTHRLVVQI